MAGKDRDRFSTATRLRLLGEQTAARVYRSQTRRQARRSRLTGRAAFLALIVCSLVVAIAYPMRQYVSQRGEMAEQRERMAEAGRQVERLRDEKARLQDDMYIRRLAREHLHYVLPGETGYTMIDPEAAERRRAEDGPGRPWYSNVWDGVDSADRG
ncbi:MULTISPECIES: FtsB family cell division protein [Streptomyces]|uniref:Septum formation initiator family protein n=2 Tax=Streptomyces TaxID=1883 RepID=A0A646KKG9_STRJU|nr:MULTISPECIES: septum formation initiator family protein [Streptomyces]MQS34675.1 septum formation initiator family protein [Streptomyces katsurahamanus]MQT01546.1 septum formation initiator family protein [Streptomyces jumonjinensis]